MTEKRKPLEAFTSPVGMAVFPWISKSDTRFDADGVYKTSLAVPFEEAQGFIAALEKARDAFIATLDVAQQQQYTAAPVYVDEMSRPKFEPDATDEEKAAIKKTFLPEPTGNVLFKFKLNSKVTPRDPDKEPFTQAPVVVGAADGVAITEPVYNGSVIRVRGQIAPYTSAASKVAGLTLRMKAVQVIELVSGSGGGNSGFWTDFGS